MYDTFHEPFKRVAPSHHTIPETPTQNNAETLVVSEAREEEKDESNQEKKEPELTVKSALSAAFAKYADKVDRKNSKSQRKNGKGTSAPVEVETEK